MTLTRHRKPTPAQRSATLPTEHDNAMPRHSTLIFIALLLTFPNPARAETIGKVRLQQIINTLMDSHAASSEKAEACIALADAGPEGLRAVPALVRQSRYDMP